MNRINTAPSPFYALYVSVVALAALICSLGLCSTASGVAQSSKSQSYCGPVFVVSVDFWYGGYVRTRGLRCKTADRVAKYAMTHNVGNAPLGPRGWGCARGSAVDELEFACDHERTAATVKVLELVTQEWNQCGTVAFEAGPTDWGAFNIQARRVTCNGARRIASGSKGVGPVTGGYDYRLEGFHCLGKESLTGPSVYWRCIKGERAVFFNN